MNREDFHKDEFYDAYILGTLSAAEEDLFEEHLLFCEDCRSEIELREAVVSGSVEGEDTSQDKSHKWKLSQRGIIIRLSIAASVIIIAGYSLYRIYTPLREKGIVEQEKIPKEAPSSQEAVIESDTNADSIQIPETGEKPENFLAEAFKPLPMFENAIVNQVRSGGFTLLTPDNSKTFTTGEKIEFSWESGEKQLTIVIYNNKGSVVFHKNTESPFTLDDKLQPGLYYWQIETEDEALQTARFMVRPLQ
jgi:hypothetical protein